MPASQQSMISPSSGVGNVPDPRTINGLFSARDTPGAALANLLGVTVDTMSKDKNRDNQPSQMEKDQLAALAQMGAEKDRLKLAGGQSVFGLMKSPDSSIDSFQLNRGRREADIFAGKLRDAYAQSGLAENDDPKAFEEFVKAQQAEIWGSILKDADPSFQHGFVTNVAQSFQDMALAHAGNLDGYVASRNKLAMTERVNQRVAIDTADISEQTAFSTLTDTLMAGESGGNYNAYHSNANNHTIRFTDMTLQDVMDWQSSGQWQKNGAGSSAVGKYQFVGNTLKAVVRAAGLDPKTTKFTPEVQDKLFLTTISGQYRRGNKYTLENFLDGTITAEQLLDNTLTSEWAALKGSSGRGKYDGDGKNASTVGASKTIAALLAFRDAYQKDPNAARIAKDEAGKATLIGADSPVGSLVDNAEAEFGVRGGDVRTAAANAYIAAMEANPAIAERNDLEDKLASAKLSAAERQKVIAARDRIRDESSHNAALQERERNDFLASAADQFLRNGDKQSLAEIKKQNPEVHSKLLALVANPPKIDDPKAAKAAFEERVSYSDPDFKIKALEAVANGQIDKATYGRVIQQFETNENAKAVLELPGVEDFVGALESTIPESSRKPFRQMLANAMTDLKEQNGGKRPPITAILSEIQTLHQSFSQSLPTAPQQVAGQQQGGSSEAQRLASQYSLK